MRRMNNMKNYMNFKEFRTDLNKAMEDIAKKYNITLTAGNITYDNTTFTIKVNGRRDDVDVDKEKFMEMLGYMQYYGFKEDDYKKEFEMKGRKYYLVGFKPGNKYDVVAQRDDGKQFAMVSSGVIKALGR